MILKNSELDKCKDKEKWMRKIQKDTCFESKMVLNKKQVDFFAIQNYLKFQRENRQGRN